ncbi:KR domain-containing protein, partial [Nonomuraea sp. NPDC050643]|uniref:KR domain-containing protein n=1 Tax=Nonomuraea sp. NPDC050643 TaxID=3155660 RepID=UPI0033EDB732
QPINYTQGIKTLHNLGTTTYIELGPDTTLTTLTKSILDNNALITPTLHPKHPETHTITTTLAQAHLHGHPWTNTLLAPHNPQPTTLPTYPFQRRHYWLDAGPAKKQARNDKDQEGRLWDAVLKGDLKTLSSTLMATDDQRSALKTLLPLLSTWRRHLDCQYRITWNLLPDTYGPPPTGTWLVAVADGRAEDGFTKAVLDALTEHGLDPIPMMLGSGAEGPGGTTVRGVLSLLALGSEPVEATTAHLMRALDDAGVDAPVWAVTCGAMPVEESDPPADPVQARMWGLGRAIGWRTPGRWGGLVDVPEVLDARMRERLARVLAGAGGEDQVALRASGAYVRRLVRLPEGPGEQDALPLPPGATALVTGGGNPLAGQAARWLADHGIERLILLSGAEVGEELKGLQAELAGRGARVKVARGDVRDRAFLTEVLDGIPADRPLSVVVHVPPLQGTSADDLEAAAALDESTRDLAAAFVIFSSVAGTIGTAGGEADAAPEQAYLEALAHRRRRRGAPVLHVAWGPWAEDVGTAGEETDDALLRPLSPRHAMGVLGRAFQGRGESVVIADADWERLAAGEHGALFRAVAGTTPAPPEDPPIPAPDLHDRLAAATSEAERLDILLDLIRATTAVVLNLAPSDPVDPDANFLDLGFTSLAAVEFSKQLRLRDIELSPAAMYDSPTPAALAKHLYSELAQSGRVPGPEGDQTS